jgi:hypothetical protein
MTEYFKKELIEYLKLFDYEYEDPYTLIKNKKKYRLEKVMEEYCWNPTLE